MEAVGGDGGIPFDSGCNPFGVKKVTVTTGPFWGNKEVIQRIHLEFNYPTSAGSESETLPSFPSFAVHNEEGDTDNKVGSLVLYPNDCIVQVDVWSTGIVRAVQFHTKCGIISPLFGSPTGDSVMTEFRAPAEEDAELVGVHGRYGGVIDKLGFSFAKVNHQQEELAVPTTICTADSGSQEQEDSTMMASTAEVEEYPRY